MIDLILDPADVDEILTALAPSWAPHQHDITRLVRVCVNRPETAVLAALDALITTHPGTPPDPEWLIVRIGRYATGAEDTINAHRRAAREAIRSSRSR